MNLFLKKTILQLILVLAFGTFLAVPAGTTHAEPGKGLGEYVPLVPLPEKFFPKAEGYELASYLKGMFRFLIALAGLLAVVMIVIGGIQYMSTDAMEGKSDGKEKIWNAIWGLILALVSWLILYSINPKLLDFNFNPGNPQKITEPSAPVVNPESKPATVNGKKAVDTGI